MVFLTPEIYSNRFWIQSLSETEKPLWNYLAIRHFYVFAKHRRSSLEIQFTTVQLRIKILSKMQKEMQNGRLQWEDWGAQFNKNMRSIQPHGLTYYSFSMFGIFFLLSSSFPFRCVWNGWEPSAENNIISFVEWWDIVIRCSVFEYSNSLWKLCSCGAIFPPICKFLYNFWYRSSSYDLKYRIIQKISICIVYNTFYWDL